MKYSYLSFCLLVFFIISCDSTENIGVNEDDLTQFVDPFIGTGEHGHVYPGATVPFGMVQLSPDNGTAGWDWCSGYNWDDDKIVGFSHTHLSGTGIGDLLDISTMPFTGDLDLSKKSTPRESDYAANFSHENEQASPGYYSVNLDNGITVELTASTYTGRHRITFPENKEAKHLIDLGFMLNWDKVTASSIRKIDEYTIEGSRLSTGWAKDQRVYFVMKYNHPIKEIEFADSTLLSVNKTSIEGIESRAVLNFGVVDKLELQVGLSSASIEGARKSLTTDEHSFDKLLAEAKKRWNKELKKIKIDTPNEALKKTFYTALYRTCLAPTTFSDPNGQYKGADNKVKTTANKTRYDLWSLWDTFRAANPLHTVIQRDKINEYISSLLNHYEEYGLLPVWSLLGNETNTMTGYHAVPVIVDAYLKGYRDYDVELAFEALKKSASQDIRGTNLYREYGYIPHDLEGQSVTRTLEYAYDDWCIAMMAKEMGKEADYQEFMKRAMYYKNMFDASSGFMRGRLKNKSWKSPFDPQFSNHDWDVSEYTEGNAWQHSWFVPHDPAGLIELLGGDAKFNVKLDSLFAISSEIKGENASMDISGLIGQYAHGNEPSHHIAYLYNYSGAPYKSQAILDSIMWSQYNDTPYGLCGNEDAGQMSAWYVWSAMGFYPVNPAQSIYVIGRPMMDEAVIDVAANTKFKITTINNSKENKYIQGVMFDGKEWDKTYISHSELIKGGNLEITMGNKPNKNWGAKMESRPPSLVLNSN